MAAVAIRRARGGGGPPVPWEPGLGRRGEGQAEAVLAVKPLTSLQGQPLRRLLS